MNQPKTRQQILSENIKYARLKRNMDIFKVSEITGIEPYEIEYMEDGMLDITHKSILKFAIAYQTSIHFLENFDTSIEITVEEMQNDYGDIPPSFILNYV